VKDEGVCAKVAFAIGLYKTSDISETNQSRAKLTTECL